MRAGELSVRVPPTPNSTLFVILHLHLHMYLVV